MLQKQKITFFENDKVIDAVKAMTKDNFGSVDQIRFCKRKRSKNRLKGDIVFWKGHVGIKIDLN